MEGRLIESIIMLSGEMNAGMSREMETMMDFMQTQISRAISSAISERIIPIIQNMVENLPLSHHGVEPCTFLNEESIGNVWRTKIPNLQRRTQGPLVILGKIRTSLLTTSNMVFVLVHLMCFCEWCFFMHPLVGSPGSVDCFSVDQRRL